MAAQVFFCFTAFLVIFLSVESTFARSSNVKNANDLDSGKVIVKGNYNSVNLYPESVKTVLRLLQKKIESMKGRLDASEKHHGMYGRPFVSIFAKSNSLSRNLIRCR